ncbi:hypothetical protein M569_08624 [Genlisea aurea]|uniref:non-specific serine/threonine protein kinase n=1 Tax=Genlisea aurea TaxID=192259 RepID=S8E1G8_9LAMI|nr:hypothetical protein M569_08624 [Genlisea aurea]
MGCFLSVEKGAQEDEDADYSSGKSDDVFADPSSSSDAAKTAVKFVQDIQDLSRGNGDIEVFTHDEMKLATGSFRRSCVIGCGGFGSVYRGIIGDSVRPGFSTTQVAIKVLNPEGQQGDREWLAEVNYQGQLRHPNLVKLIGYCCESDHRLLVYEYMASGCLEEHLFQKVNNNLTWQKRLKIAFDAAKGLAFLHDLESPIIYRDFKSSNILLDEDFKAKLSDFGLARLGPTGDQTHVSTRVMGTYGYAAPEYLMTGHLTAKNDVYGFGVVLLEMLSGKRATDKNRPCKEHNLVKWARPLLKNNMKLLSILDPNVEGQYSTESLMKVAKLAYLCLSENPKVRPDMSQVLKKLEPIVAQEIRRQEAMPSKKGDGGSVTLFEVPENKHESTGEIKRKQHRTDRDRRVVPEKNRDLRKSRSQRSLNSDS